MWGGPVVRRSINPISEREKKYRAGEKGQDRNAVSGFDPGKGENQQTTVTRGMGPLGWASKTLLEAGKKGTGPMPINTAKDRFQSSSSQPRSRQARSVTPIRNQVPIKPCCQDPLLFDVSPRKDLEGVGDSREPNDQSRGKQNVENRTSPILPAKERARGNP